MGLQKGERGRKMDREGVTAGLLSIGETEASGQDSQLLLSLSAYMGRGAGDLPHLEDIRRGTRLMSR